MSTDDESKREQICEDILGLRSRENKRIMDNGTRVVTSNRFDLPF